MKLINQTLAKKAQKEIISRKNEIKKNEAKRMRNHLVEIKKTKSSLLIIKHLSEKYEMTQRNVQAIVNGFYKHVESIAINKNRKIHLKYFIISKKKKKIK